MQGEARGAVTPGGDWDEDFDRSSGYPLAATLLGIVPVVAICILLGTLEPNPQQTVARALGTGVVVALIAWGVAYAVTLRHGGSSWKIGSLLILIVAGLIASLGSVGYKYSLLQQDFSTLAETRFVADGKIVAPPGAEQRGPLSRLFLGYVRAMAADRQALDAKLASLGFDRLRDPDGLTRDPAILSNCNKLNEGKIATGKTYAMAKARMADVQKKIGALDIPANIRADMRKGMLQSGGPAALDAQRDLLDAEIDENRNMCGVLARRNWRPEGGRFAFTSNADLARFNMFVDSIASIQEEAARIQVERTSEVQQQQAQMRGALD